MRVREYRSKYNLTQTQLAKMLGVSRQHISAIELGHNKISIDILEKIYLLLDTSPCQMLDYPCLEDCRGVDKIMMITDKIKDDIKLLISSGTIKREEELEDMSLDNIYKIAEKFNICIKDLLCYFCFKSNGKCRDENCI
ncbi:helix-turn-helix transcriptional regulator [Clostridium sp. FP1]|uniref:helix-turn-helix transcriptional regulator n=1 Tax=Clostridium sp. FP1 TaxID=2724076 RepID=UPI0013E961A0|nr:helix-turn-helix transcriptional regulator [Clostridium sp. FP1]MBZ9633224.1 helix-turn-helix transcriptional regulator [Clostridium sp. FP1]